MSLRLKVLKVVELPVRVLLESGVVALKGAVESCAGIDQFLKCVYRGVERRHAFEQVVVCVVESARDVCC